MTDDSELVGWVSPTGVSSIDNVELAEIVAGWEPARVGEIPLEAAVAVIRAVGIVDPILLRPAAGGYEIVTGHRVVAAARRAGLERVPAVVRLLDDGQALMAQALDGTTSGSLTVTAADELERRLRAAHVEPSDIEDVMTAVAVEPRAATAAPPPVAAAPTPAGAAPPAAMPTAAPAMPTALTVATAPAVPPPPAAAPAPASQPPIAVSAPARAAPEQPVPRWIPLPSAEPRLARLSSAFADSSRMLELVAADGFTGVIELVGLDGRRDAVTLLEGQCVAVSVEEAGRRVPRNLRLPGPERGPIVEISVRPHQPTVVVALAMALRTPARLVGLDARWLHFDGLLDSLSRRGRDAAVVVSTPSASGVVLLSGGEPIAAYARREGEATGVVAETNDLSGVAELLSGGEGEVDVHDGPLVEPLDLARLIASASTGGE